MQEIVEQRPQLKRPRWSWLDEQWQKVRDAGNVGKFGWRGVLIRHGVVLAVLLATFTASGLTMMSTFALGACPGQERTHTVAFGDTLSGIAWKYGSTVAALASHNRIANVNLIFAGQRICIPVSGGGGSSSVPVPTSKNQYVSLARQYAAQAGVSPDIFVRQIQRESGFNPNALSPSGAIGIAQFMPATAASLGINPHDPVQSLRGAAMLMSRYLRDYGGDYAKALAAYNAGPGNVQYAVRIGGGNWRAYLPYETKHYLNVVLG